MLWKCCFYCGYSFPHVGMANMGIICRSSCSLKCDCDFGKTNHFKGVVLSCFTCFVEMFFLLRLEPSPCRHGSWIVPLVSLIVMTQISQLRIETKMANCVLTAEISWLLNGYSSIQAFGMVLEQPLLSLIVIRLSDPLLITDKSRKSGLRQKWPVAFSLQT